MISLESGYLKDLANNINLTQRCSVEPLDVLLLITEILELRDEHSNIKPDQLACSPEVKAESLEGSGPQCPS